MMCNSIQETPGVPPKLLKSLIDEVDSYLRFHDLQVTIEEKMETVNNDFEGATEITELIEDAQNKQENARVKMIICAEMLLEIPTINEDIRRGIHRLSHRACDGGGGPEAVKKLWEDLKVNLKLLLGQEMLTEKNERLKNLATLIQQANSESHHSEELTEGVEVVEEKQPILGKTNNVGSSFENGPRAVRERQIVEVARGKVMKAKQIHTELSKKNESRYALDTVQKSCTSLAKLKRGVLGKIPGQGYYVIDDTG